MIALDKISRDEFEACLHETFTIVHAGGKLAVELHKVVQLTGAAPDAKREPFSVQFNTPSPMQVPQGIYRVEHDRLGAMELFLVQVSPSEVEVVFN